MQTSFWILIEVLQDKVLPKYKIWTLFVPKYPKNLFLNFVLKMYFIFS